MVRVVAMPSVGWVVGRAAQTRCPADKLQRASIHGVEAGSHQAWEPALGEGGVAGLRRQAACPSQSSPQRNAPAAGHSAPGCPPCRQSFCPPRSAPKSERSWAAEGRRDPRVEGPISSSIKAWLGSTTGEIGGRRVGQVRHHFNTPQCGRQMCSTSNCVPCCRATAQQNTATQLPYHQPPPTATAVATQNCLQH